MTEVVVVELCNQALQLHPTLRAGLRAPVIVCLFYNRAWHCCSSTSGPEDLPDDKTHATLIPMSQSNCGWALLGLFVDAGVYDCPQDVVPANASVVAPLCAPCFGLKCDNLVTSPLDFNVTETESVIRGEAQLYEECLLKKRG